LEQATLKAYEGFIELGATPTIYIT